MRTKPAIGTNSQLRLRSQDWAYLEGELLQDFSVLALVLRQISEPLSGSLEDALQKFLANTELFQPCLVGLIRPGAFTGLSPLVSVRVMNVRLTSASAPLPASASSRMRRRYWCSPAGQSLPKVGSLSALIAVALANEHLFDREIFVGLGLDLASLLQCLLLDERHLIDV